MLEKNGHEVHVAESGETGIEKAKLLIEKYQYERLTKVRYEQSKKGGGLGVFIRELFNNPMQYVIYIAIAAAVLYFSIKPFLNFGQ